MDELKSFLLANVKSTGKTIGAGSYGSVEEVEVFGAICAAKQIHDVFQDPNKVRAIDIRKASEQSVKECRLMTTIRHPNIVQFLGICEVPGSRLPGLVMERLDANLHDLLDPEMDLPPPPDSHKPFFPHHLKCSILQNVASGLTYLQERLIVHRDLSARNILLTSGMVAKIADLGMARILNHLTSTSTLTKAPGSTVYMPPEALESKADSTKAVYNSTIDIFSFGVLSIFTLSQTFPCDLLAPNYRRGARHIARTELERRDPYMQKIYNPFHKKHPFVVLIKRCLDFPENRPGIHEVVNLLKQGRAESKRSHKDMNMLDLMQALQTQIKVGDSLTEVKELRLLKVDLEQRIIKFKAEREMRDLEQQEMHKSLQSLGDEVNKLTSENSVLNGKNIDANAKLDKVQQELQAVLSEREELKSALEATTAMAKIYEEVFKSEREDRTRAFEEREKEGKHYREEIDRLQKQFSSTCSSQETKGKESIRKTASASAISDDVTGRYHAPSPTCPQSHEYVNQSQILHEMLAHRQKSSQPQPSTSAGLDEFSLPPPIIYFNEEETQSSYHPPISADQHSSK